MTMIERVAAVIDPMAWAVPEDDYPAERARRYAKQQTSLQQARRAIKEMREPTCKMRNLFDEFVYDCWKEMIDLALSEDYQ